ncbi:hypothetical protein [Deinococcus ficus]|uniref:hypothetical protein n=1 Tax=Deinococcus ficus TaxID=317577 RepID=UPI0012DCFE63|nr:hypothetical protein [Deinococcus ficus]
MTHVHVGTFDIQVWDRVPAHDATLRQRATLVDEYNLHSREPGIIPTVTIAPQGGDPALLVSQHRALDPQGFPLGVVVVPDTSLVLIGAAQRLLAYDFITPERSGSRKNMWKSASRDWPSMTR